MRVQRHVTAAGLAVATLLLLVCASHVRAYSFVPILSVFYGGDSTATLAGDKAICLKAGGYVATEATALLHSVDVETISNAIGASTEFYAFLGGGINFQYSQAGGTPTYCPWNTEDPDVPNIPAVTGGNDTVCLYRWKVGRWQMLTSDVGVEVDGEHAGIAFYKGIGSGGIGSVNGFPSFFYQIPDKSVYSRPGTLRARNVILFRNTETATLGTDALWSDNFASGGYTYANPIGLMPELAAAKSPLFKTICQAQGPFRLNYEEPNASTLQKSNLQYVWWIIFLVILFVLCLIAYLVVACCQEREDMDEPPEEAPEWAEKETEQRNVSKRYVSQRSFRDTEGSERPSRSGSSRSAGSSERSSISSVSKEDEYDEERAH